MVKEIKESIEPLKEKLDEKIAKLNSSRVFKKVTPRYDLSWYIKWTGSIFLIVAMMMTSANIFPMNLYVALSSRLSLLPLFLMRTMKSLAASPSIFIFPLFPT